jgi:hypothetical protein
MNCQPGDLAIVISPVRPYAGRLVEVLYAPPSGDYTLPNGQRACCDHKTPCWVLKFIGGEVPAPLDTGGTRMTLYGCGADRSLRPLRGLLNESELEDGLALSERAGE